MSLRYLTNQSELAAGICREQTQCPKGTYLINTTPFKAGTCAPCNNAECPKDNQYRAGICAYKTNNYTCEDCAVCQPGGSVVVKCTNVSNRVCTNDTIPELHSEELEELVSAGFGTFEIGGGDTTRASVWQGPGRYARWSNQREWRPISYKMASSNRGLSHLSCTVHDPNVLASASRSASRMILAQCVCV